MPCCPPFFERHASRRLGLPPATKGNQIPAVLLKDVADKKEIVIVLIPPNFVSLNEISWRLANHQIVPAVVGKDVVKDVIVFESIGLGGMPRIASLLVRVMPEFNATAPVTDARIIVNTDAPRHLHEDSLAINRLHVPHGRGD